MQRCHPAATQAAIIHSVGGVAAGGSINVSGSVSVGTSTITGQFVAGAANEIKSTLLTEFPDDNSLLHALQVYYVFADEVKVWLAHPGSKSRGGGV